MAIAQIYTACVMHRRFFPKANRFSYGAYYLALPLEGLTTLGDHLAVNRRSAISFYEKDHGKRDGSALETWVRAILQSYGLSEKIDQIRLIALPRLFGYVFNPVSFWFCLDKQQKIRAVICEVNNTFSETHSYMCAHADHRPIEAEDWLEASKEFHVSPFLERRGYYRFRFSLKPTRLHIWIDYYNDKHQRQFITSLSGELSPLTKQALRKIFWRKPWLMLKPIFLIHWQALKLFFKGEKYVPKPEQHAKNISASSNHHVWIFYPYYAFAFSFACT